MNISQISNKSHLIFSNAYILVLFNKFFIAAAIIVVNRSLILE